MATSISRSSTVRSLPPPSPKSPPEYPDLYGKRREMARVQMLEREISFLEEELKSVQGLQPASRCCKEVAEFVLANSDPLLPTTKKSRRSCRFWKWLWYHYLVMLLDAYIYNCQAAVAGLVIASHALVPPSVAPYQNGNVALVLSQIAVKIAVKIAAAIAIAQTVVVSQVVLFLGVLLVRAPLAPLANPHHAALANAQHHAALVLAALVVAVQSCACVAAVQSPVGILAVGVVSIFFLEKKEKKNLKLLSSKLYL
ncbi:hypothetical protein L6164_011822 [Bauhinia variegata]|uniref:Uncharacterized protein n=1 Tax=Bauhinia variegata TaxID=167791 RepID=A0ACB9P7W2_BAUVA|nr:hypothetical protein L6164_011822 [Bauhinia variegata]